MNSELLNKIRIFNENQDIELEKQIASLFFMQKIDYIGGL
jgi:hypothetical protein